MAVDQAQFSADVIKDIGIYTQKILVTLNAGGIVALLTFIANIENSDTVVFDIWWLKLSLCGFAAGLVFVGVSLFVTYFEAQRNIYNPEHKEASIVWFLMKMTGPPILSFIVFLFALGFALSGICTP